ncbi:MAG: carbon-nitrogen hydrolase family protein [Solirubrobacterales bacterium]
MRAAVVQINSTADRARNLERAAFQVEQAAAAGAELVVLPEKWPMLAAGEELAEGAQTVDGEAVSAARGWARGHGVALLAGSFTEAHPEGLPSNTSLLISPEGEISASYRKIHMFDVDVDGVSYRESSYEQAGNRLVTADLGQARIGMAICYDLRFPELFRALIDLGANLFTLPSAFTVPTGRDHWEVLVRARAIENQSFVLAAGQVGKAEPEYDSWGHSMIVGPWGEVLAEVESGEGFAVADLDFDRLMEVRQSLPAVNHRRGNLYTEGGA